MYITVLVYLYIPLHVLSGVRISLLPVGSKQIDVHTQTYITSDN